MPFLLLISVWHWPRCLYVCWKIYPPAQYPGWSTRSQGSRRQGRQWGLSRIHSPWSALTLTFVFHPPRFTWIEQWSSLQLLKWFLFPSVKLISNSINKKLQQITFRWSSQRRFYLLHHPWEWPQPQCDDPNHPPFQRVLSIVLVKYFPVSWELNMSSTCQVQTHEFSSNETLWWILALSGSWILSGCMIERWVKLESQ